MTDEAPITEAWLSQVGFKWHSIERSPSKHWLLWCGALTGRAFESFEDLGIELSLDTSPVDSGFFYCWLRADYSGRYSRFLHIRHMRYQREVIRLIEAITDQGLESATSSLRQDLHAGGGRTAAPAERAIRSATDA